MHFAFPWSIVLAYPVLLCCFGLRDRSVSLAGTPCRRFPPRSVSSVGLRDGIAAKGLVGKEKLQNRRMGEYRYAVDPREVAGPNAVKAFAVLPARLPVRYVESVQWTRTLGGHGLASPVDIRTLTTIRPGLEMRG